jgi:hypothetical protein
MPCGFIIPYLHDIHHAFSQSANDEFDHVSIMLCQPQCLGYSHQPQSQMHDKFTDGELSGLGAYAARLNEWESLALSNLPVK